MLERIFLKKRRKPQEQLERDLWVDVMDLEFCPGLMWLFDVLYDQRKQLQRLCERFAQIRQQCGDTRLPILLEAFETVDGQYERNAREILSLCIAAGWKPEWGFYQPHFKKGRVNRRALRARLLDNQECLDKLGELIDLAVELSHRESFAQLELNSWVSTLQKMCAAA